MSADCIPAAPDTWTAAAGFSLVLPGTPLGVRDALDRAMAAPCLADLSDMARGSLWIVLAEVLNNVTEHAYATARGTIVLRLWRFESGVAAEVVDHGAPMPGLELPAGRLTDIDSLPLEDLPEGGFGWFLIRTMTDWLIYDRVGQQNRLRFCMECA